MQFSDSLIVGLLSSRTREIFVYAVTSVIFYYGSQSRPIQPQTMIRVPHTGIAQDWGPSDRRETEAPLRQLQVPELNYPIEFHFSFVFIWF